MTRSTLSAVCGAILLTIIGAAGCAPATTTLRIDPSSVPAASRLADVHLTPGSGAIVRLVSGEAIRGTLKDLRPDRLELLVKTFDNDSRARTIPEGEIETIASIVGLSKGARTRIGAAIGAAITVPFGISMVSDMIVPGAIAGAFSGRATGDSRGEIVYARPAQRP